jgi:hypothetical protein
VQIALDLPAEDGAFCVAASWTEIEQHFLSTAQVCRP